MQNSFSLGPRAKQGIETIKAYMPGKSGPKTGKIFKLSSNESPLGPSSAAVAAYASKADAGLAIYPDGSSALLREAIAERYNLNAANIVCGGLGSDELLQLLAQAYLGPGDEAIYSQFGFLVYPIVIATNGANAVVAPEHHFVANVGEVLARVTSKTKMVFLANPNNPTGTYLSFEALKRLHAGLPSSVLLVLDGAYAEYVLADDYESGIAFVECSSNVVMTRTFSKIFGLAGVRLGWAYCPPVIADVLNRIRAPFNVSTPAMAAGTAAMNDMDHLKKAVSHNAQWLKWLTGEVSKLGLEVTPSVANFILVHFRNADRAAAADQFLAARGIIIRKVDAYGLPQALRISIGTEEANRAVANALTEFMQ
jgi:histidinol-phosphate aminotransferase